MFHPEPRTCASCHIANLKSRLSPSPPCRYPPRPAGPTEWSNPRSCTMHSASDLAASLTVLKPSASHRPRSRPCPPAHHPGCISVACRRFSSDPRAIPRRSAVGANNGTPGPTRTRASSGPRRVRGQRPDLGRCGHVQAGRAGWTPRRPSTQEWRRAVSASTGLRPCRAARRGYPRTQRRRRRRLNFPTTARTATAS